MAHRSTQLCCVSDFPWFSRASNECSYGMGEKTSTHSHSQHFAASYSAACSRKMPTKSSLDFKVSRLVASRRVLIWRLQKGFSRTKAIECDNGFWDRLFFFVSLVPIMCFVLARVISDQFAYPPWLWDSGLWWCFMLYQHQQQQQSEHVNRITGCVVCLFGDRRSNERRKKSIPVINHSNQRSY